MTPLRLGLETHYTRLETACCGCQLVESPQSLSSISSNLLLTYPDDVCQIVIFCEILVLLEKFKTICFEYHNLNQQTKAMGICVYRNRRRNQGTAAQRIKSNLLFLFFYLLPTQFLCYSATNGPTEMADHFS